MCWESLGPFQLFMTGLEKQGVPGSVSEAPPNWESHLQRDRPGLDSGIWVRGRERTILVPPGTHLTHPLLSGYPPLWDYCMPWGPYPFSLAWSALTVTVHRIKARIAGAGAALSLQCEEKGGGGQVAEVYLTPPGEFSALRNQAIKDWDFLSHFLSFLLFLPLPLPECRNQNPRNDLVPPPVEWHIQAPLPSSPRVSEAPLVGKGVLGPQPHCCPLGTHSVPFMETSQSTLVQKLIIGPPPPSPALSGETGAKGRQEPPQDGGS